MAALAPLDIFSGRLSIALLVFLVGCSRHSSMANSVHATEIIPGKAIGAVKLGVSRDALPRTAELTDESGKFEGVRFSLGSDGHVSDIWIEDIRVFPNTLLLGGRPVPVKAPLDEVKNFFGECVEVAGIKGGKFFNCSSGVSLGCRYDGTDDFIQLRIRHR
jgi:hypothetical protein